jgi:hypothetical protein
MNPKETEALAIGDSKELKQNRKFARVWLKSDFDASQKEMCKRKENLAGSQEEYIEIKTSERFADEFSSSESLGKDTNIPV